MLDVFRGLKNLIKVSSVHVDSPVFRLHYSITVMILLAFSLIVTTRQYVGNPIDCVHTKDIPEDVLNTYCWIHSTYTMKNAFKKKVGVVVPYPGVDNSRGSQDERKCYTYYQWVCFCLFFQVINDFYCKKPPVRHQSRLNGTRTVAGTFRSEFVLVVKGVYVVKTLLTILPFVANPWQWNGQTCQMFKPD
ncbi:hypothetical protein AAG570_011432 [Ranatra chinensis]|uniref:Innexin n=1 Tax=Ranatra chinensis TaxID=642074 RepID=A0ABD0YKN3_9HEMI